MKQEVLQTIKKYNLIESGDKLVIGVSGGPDSMCLLHLLNDLRSDLGFDICVAHVNHMIRDEAEEETQYVKDFCEKIGVDCYIKRADVVKISKEEKKGTEETGRIIRYNFFDEIMNESGSNKIATAHNNNDKAETVIMNIMRGTGISGLKGIEPIRDNKYIRPLINIERKEIEDYCSENNLKPKIDSSNSENDYRRNKIRNIVVPYIIEEYNPNIIKTLNRLAEVATEEDEFLEKITSEIFQDITKVMNSKEIELDLKRFNSLDLVIRRRIILYAINQLVHTTCGIEKVNIDDIIKLCGNNIGNKYLRPIKNVKVLIKNRKIIFTTE